MSSIERPAMVAAGGCSTANMLFAAYICSRVGQILPIIVARKNARLSPLNSTEQDLNAFRPPSGSIGAPQSVANFRRPIGRPAPRLAPPCPFRIRDSAAFQLNGTSPHAIKISRALVVAVAAPARRRFDATPGFAVYLGRWFRRGGAVEVRRFTARPTRI